jgi:hypothetical protein
VNSTGAAAAAEIAAVQQPLVLHCLLLLTAVDGVRHRPLLDLREEIVKTSRRVIDGRVERLHQSPHPLLSLLTLQPAHRNTGGWSSGRLGEDSHKQGLGLRTA